MPIACGVESRCFQHVPRPGPIHGPPEVRWSIQTSDTEPGGVSTGGVSLAMWGEQGGVSLGGG